jgi:DUF2075 family protein
MRPGRSSGSGCVYTVLGFEFGYVHVLWARYFRCDSATWDLICDPSKSHDAIVKRFSDRFTDLVNCTYRGLLTSGLKGCYVCSAEGATCNEYVQGRGSRV